MGADRKYGDSKSLDDQQWLELERETPYQNRGDDETYIPNWLSAFGEESILFIPFKEINANPLHTMDVVENFVGIRNYKAYPS